MRITCRALDCPKDSISIPCTHCHKITVCSHCDHPQHICIQCTRPRRPRRSSISDESMEIEYTQELKDWEKRHKTWIDDYDIAKKDRRTKRQREKRATRKTKTHTAKSRRRKPSYEAKSITRMTDSCGNIEDHNSVSAFENSEISANLVTSSRQSASTHDSPTKKLNGTPCTHTLDESLNATTNEYECHRGHSNSTNGDNILGPQKRQDFGRNTEIGAISATSGTGSRQIASIHGSPTKKVSETPCSHELNKTSNPSTNRIAVHGGHSMSTNESSTFGPRKQQSFGGLAQI